MKDSTASGTPVSLAKPAPQEISQPLFDGSRILSGIRLRRPMWCALGLIGLICGLALSLLVPPAHTAVASVLIAHSTPQAEDPHITMDTDIALLETTSVAGHAVSALGLRTTPEAFLATYSGKSISPHVLQIRTTGGDDGDAVNRDRAIVNAFIFGHDGRAQATADAQSHALLNRSSDLQKEVADTNNDIALKTVQGALLPAGSRQAADVSGELDALYARRSGLTSQILDLSQRADDAQLAAQAVKVGTQVVDQPRTLSRSVIRAGIINGVTGLVLGLGLGLGIAAVASITRDRPVLRGDIAQAVGVPVVAQLPRRRRGLRALLRRQHRRTELERVAFTLAGVVARAPQGMALLEVGCAQDTAELGVRIAAFLARRREVVLIDDLPRGVLARARGRARHQLADVTSVDLMTRDAPSDDMPLRLGLGSAGPGAVWPDLTHLGSEALVVITPGHISGAWLRDLCWHLDDADISVVGLVLVGGLTKDQTDGTPAQPHYATTSRRAMVDPGGA